MNTTHFRFGGTAAIVTGLLSILYAVFYLLVTRSAPALGAAGSWLILGVSGLFSGAAYVALYLRTRQTGAGLALWAFALGAMASFATFQHGAFEFLTLQSQPTASGAPATSQVDPAGLATFLVVGLVSLLFSLVILRGSDLPRGLGYLGIFNALLLIVLYFASASAATTLILISGGLTSVIVGPIWWIWLGAALLRQP